MNTTLIAVIIISVFLSQVSGKLQCIGTCYSGRLSPEDIHPGKHLQGYSYKNITTDNHRKCYSFCIQDCRCKASQIKDSKCELLDEDKNSKPKRLTDGPGYLYMDLKQTMYRGKPPKLPWPPGGCYNGCCQAQPCKNGGTCVEQCDRPKIKFSCKCTAGYGGHICDKRFKSCVDVLANGEINSVDGFYTIFRDDNQKKDEFYCSFEKPNRVWTLIESSSFGLNPFKKVRFSRQYGVFHSNPINWSKYRLSSSAIQYARSKSSLYRSTCNFPQRINSYKDRDYLFGYFKDATVDFITDTEGFYGKCLKFVHMNIRGYSYKNVSFPIWQTGNEHLHVDATQRICKPVVTVPNAVQNEDSFGYYSVHNDKFTCTSTLQSTTQWWLGEQV